MPGATLQLVSRGSQDIYLTGNPQITFFKVVYRRHTNFSMDDIILDTIKTPGFGTHSTVTIKHFGDLIHKVSLVYKANNIYAGHGLANPTTALIKHIELSIGGNLIDKQRGDFIEAWMELTKPNPNGTICNITHIDDISISHLASNSDIVAATAYKSSASGSSKSYFDNRLNKLTNILGTGISYPSTKFQKSSRSGGVYCEPTFLQEIQSGVQEQLIAPHFDIIYNDTPGISIDMAPSLHANGSGAQNASCSDFHITSATLSASTTGGNTQGTVDHFLSASGMLASLPNIKKSLITGSILGLCTLEIPFWFSKDPGLSIPLIALQHSEVNLDIHFSENSDANWTETTYDPTKGWATGPYIAYNGTISNNQNVFNAFSTEYLYPLKQAYNNHRMGFDIDIKIQYIYLDTDERRRFSEISHEYLIEQIQHTSFDNGELDIDLSTFNHPVKELIWCGKPYKKGHIKYADGGVKSVTNRNLNNGFYAHPSGTYFQPGISDNIAGGTILSSSYTLGFGNTASVNSRGSSEGHYSTGADNVFSSNGKFVVGLLGPSTARSLDDCNWQISINDISRTSTLPLQHYTRDNVHAYHTGYGSVSAPDSIAVYSFALKPEEHQPSGTCNFSNIDRVQLHRYKGQRPSNANPVPLNVFAINYNILRIMGGRCNLAYM